MLAACSSDGDNNDAVGSDNVGVAFTLSVADASYTRAANESSRAVNEGWDNYEPNEDGTDEENMININDILIFLCDDSGYKIADIEDVHVSLVSESDGKKRYNITGIWRKPAEKLSMAKKVMVLANCNVKAQTSTSTDIAEYTFDINSPAYGYTSGKYIPMWGVATLPALTLGKCTQLDPINVLRAMAKIKVELRDDMKAYGYSIADMTLNGYNTRGYCLPKEYNNVADTKNLQFATSFNPLDSKAATGMSLTEATPVYVPEYYNTDVSSSATHTSISLKLSCNGTKGHTTYTLHFRNYANGAPTGDYFNIQRNHFYTYIIYKEKDQLAVELHVRKWNKREHDDIIM